jgi:hypothetical protein
MSSPDAAQGKNVQQKQEKSKEKESNMGKLDGKIALVTGASKGIGAGIALSLAKEGAAVAVNYASDRKGADRVVERIKAAGGKAIAVQGSVTSSEEIDRFFSETEKQLGNVDVLVNNAGVFAYLPLQDVNEKELGADSLAARRSSHVGILAFRRRRAFSAFSDTWGTWVGLWLPICTTLPSLSAARRCCSDQAKNASQSPFTSMHRSSNTASARSTTQRIPLLSSLSPIT